jgi:hypothetical protein
LSLMQSIAILQRKPSLCAESRLCGRFATQQQKD